jgi:hypothetical protein
MSEDYFFGSADNADAELVVVQDHARAQEICAALQQADIEHVRCLPDELVSGKGGAQGSDFWDQLSTGTSDSQGPWHIRVLQDDLAKARQIMADSGMKEA